MKMLEVHYPANIRKVQLKTSFQVNKLAKILMQDFGNFSDVLEYDLDKCNKLTLSLSEIVAVLSQPAKDEPSYELQIGFKDGREFNIPIWGEKRARNSYYFFREQMQTKSDNLFHKILQTNERDFSLIKLYTALQFVRLNEPKAPELFERNKNGTQSTSNL